MFFKPLRLVPDDININIMGVRHYAFALSIFVCLASIGLLGFKGLNFGIDFTGGSVMEVRMEPAPDLGDMRSKLDALGLGELSIQNFGTAQDILIRMPQQGSPEAQKAAEASVRGVLDALGPQVEYRRIEYVGPQVGDELVRDGTMAVLLAIIGIMGYIWMRFEWQFGVATVATLVHDAIIMLGFFVVTHVEFNLATLAAVLTITGYSVNDTVVVFDFVRDTMKKYRKMPMIELLNLSINRTFSRTILTSLTAFLALVALVVFGGEVIRDFTWALIIGVVLGTYSSIFVSTPLLLYLNPRRNEARLLKDDTAESV